MGYQATNSGTHFAEAAPRLRSAPRQAATERRNAAASKSAPTGTGPPSRRMEWFWDTNFRRPIPLHGLGRPTGPDYPRNSLYFSPGMAIFETVIVSPLISPVNLTVWPACSCKAAKSWLPTL